MLNKRMLEKKIKLAKIPFDIKNPGRDIPVTVLNKSLMSCFKEMTIANQVGFILLLLLTVIYTLIQPIINFFQYFLLKPQYTKLNRLAAITAAKYSSDPNVVKDSFICENEYYTSLWEQNSKTYGLRPYDVINDYNSCAQILCNSFFLDPYSKYQFHNKPSIRHLSEYWFHSILNQSDSEICLIDHANYERITSIIVYSILKKRSPKYEHILSLMKLLSFIVKYILIRPITVYYLFRSTVMLIYKMLDIMKTLDVPELGYIKLLAVDIPYQQQGLASKLLAHIMQRFDSKGIPAYLESSSPLNIPLYEKFGFQVCEVLHVMPDAPPLYIMIRPPKPQ